ncbi:uncharacterized protein (TIGR02246 family) [Mycetocola sp. CAN_C7]|uniref:nuclear transport factor 2 family protein n=1 Tax=Mycetocola sp. CAN_C7 TaxID=2787724 RepID=UPI0018CA25AC
MNDPSVNDLSGARLGDRVQIADLLAVYCEKLDDYDIDSVAEAFTEDCVFDPGPGNGGPRTGRDAIFPAQKVRMGIYRRTQHHLGQSRIRFDGEDAANGLTSVIAWHQRWDGSVGTARLRYDDRFVRRSGLWLIAERRLIELGVEGFAEGTWNPSGRNVPHGR